MTSGILTKDDSPGFALGRTEEEDGVVNAAEFGQEVGVGAEASKKVGAFVCGVCCFT